jgi:hypothetical protein
MDRARFRNKVLLDLVSAPWTLIPAALGASCLLLAWAVSGAAHLLAFVGVAGLLIGLGSLVTRWIFRAGEIARRAFEELEGEAFKQQDAMLDDLDRRLQSDSDPRTEESLRELRLLYERFRQGGDWTREVDGKAAFDIANKVEELFRGCVRSLERSLELWESAQEMHTDEVRRKILGSREEILAEVGESSRHLARTLDGVHALALEKREASAAGVLGRSRRQRRENLAQIRSELDESLAVARRVEERMQLLDAELGSATGRLREP